MNFYLEWLSNESNIAFFLLTNTIMALLIFLIVFVADQITDYFQLKEDVKEINKKIKNLEKRKK